MKRLAPVLLVLAGCATSHHATPVSGPPVTTAPEVLGMSLVRPDYTPTPTTTEPVVVVPATVAPPVVVTTTTTAPVVPLTAAPAVPSGRSVWDDLADCESGNGVPGSGTANWHINTGNGYYGGIQFSLRSWRWVGGTGYPHEHSRETQIAMGERLRARQGWGAWPACSRKMGLR